MRKLLIVLLLIPLCGCMTINLSEGDRARVDKFLREAERFNDNVEAVRTALMPEPSPPKKPVAKVFNRSDE